jgi:hypothetical protein
VVLVHLAVGNLSPPDNKVQNYFLKTRIHARVFDRPGFTSGSRRRRVINDSGQIAATSSAPLPALARVRRGPRASGRETIGDALVSGRGRAPVARNKGSTSRLRGKFSSLQIIENSQNAERISILRETVPNAQGRAAPTGEARRVGHAHDPSVLDLTAKRSRPEMAPQRLEKIESAPGNGMASEASNPQYLVHERTADRARLRLTSRKNDKVESCRKRRPTL